MGTNTTPDKGANTGPSCSSPASSKAIDIDHHGNKGKTGTNSTVLVSVKAEGVLSSNPSAESDELRAAAAASAEETQEGTPAAAVALADKTQQGTPAAAADSKACPAASAPQQAASGSPDLSPSNVLVPANLTHKAKSVGSCSRTATKLGKAAPKPAAKTSAQASAEEELKKQFGAITPDEAAAAIIQGLASGQVSCNMHSLRHRDVLDSSILIDQLGDHVGLLHGGYACMPSIAAGHEQSCSA